MTETGPSAAGVSTVRVGEEVPRIKVGDGVEVRHLAGQDLMFRVVDLPAESTVPFEEPDQEHVVVVTAGAVRLIQGNRFWELGVDDAAMVRRGHGFGLAAVEGPAQCHVATTPPHVGLVRDLLHLEHADHGFD